MHFGCNLNTQNNGSVLLSMNYNAYLNIDNRNASLNHNRLNGVIIEADEAGAITWLQSATSTGRAAVQPNQLQLKGIHKQKHIILMHNQTASFNNQTINSPFTNIANRELYWNVSYSLLTVDSNNQTIHRFSIPNLRLYNVIVDSFGNRYIIGAYDSTISLGNQQYTPRILGYHNFGDKYSDMVVFKLNAQHQVEWSVPRHASGGESDYLLTLD